MRVMYVCMARGQLEICASEAVSRVLVSSCYSHGLPSIHVFVYGAEVKGVICFISYLTSTWEASADAAAPLLMCASAASGNPEVLRNQKSLQCM